MDSQLELDLSDFEQMDAMKAEDLKVGDLYGKDQREIFFTNVYHDRVVLTVSTKGTSLENVMNGMPVSLRYSQKVLGTRKKPGIIEVLKNLAEQKVLESVPNSPEFNYAARAWHALNNL